LRGGGIDQTAVVGIEVLVVDRIVETTIGAANAVNQPISSFWEKPRITSSWFSPLMSLTTAAFGSDARPKRELADTAGPNDLEMMGVPSALMPL
jgi:hypothetical protein